MHKLRPVHLNSHDVCQDIPRTTNRTKSALGNRKRGITEQPVEVTSVKLGSRGSKLEQRNWRQLHSRSQSFAWNATVNHVMARCSGDILIIGVPGRRFGMCDINLCGRYCHRSVHGMMVMWLWQRCNESHLPILSGYSLAAFVKDAESSETNPKEFLGVLGSRTPQ